MRGWTRRSLGERVGGDWGWGCVCVRGARADPVLLYKRPYIPDDLSDRVTCAGQPVLIGGTMGTCSYVLTGTDRGMVETFGSTCHGAGRAQSRSKSRRTLEYQEVRMSGVVYVRSASACHSALMLERRRCFTRHSPCASLAAHVHRSYQAMSLRRSSNRNHSDV